jgi:transcriptional regulator with XRE-family HTH domain
MEKERIENIIRKISATRTKKGYTYENMAHELSMTPAAYRKIEIGETKLTVERLLKISEILKAPLPDLLEIGNDVFQQTNNESATGYLQKIKNYYHENKEITQCLVESLNNEIAHLKGEIEFLRGMVKKA